MIIIDELQNTLEVISYGIFKIVHYSIKPNYHVLQEENDSKFLLQKNVKIRIRLESLYYYLNGIVRNQMKPKIANEEKRVSKM